MGNKFPSRWLRRNAAMYPVKNVAKSLVKSVTKYPSKSAAIFPGKNAARYPDKAAKMYPNKNAARYPDKNVNKFPNKNAERNPSKNALHSTFVRFANSPLMEDNSLIIIIIIFNLSLAQFFIQPGTKSQ